MSAGVGIDGLWRFEPMLDDRRSPLELPKLVFVPPDGCADLMLRFSGGLLCEAVVIQPAEHYEVVSVAPSDALFGVRFQLGFGGACVRQRELVERELARRFTGADPRNLDRVHADLADAATSFVERWCGARADWLEPALGELQRRRGNVPVAELARGVGVTERTLHRGFVEWVGASPKLLSRTLRSRAAVELACGTEALVEVAAELGYADQAHLSRELRELWGVTPAGVRRRLAGPGGVVMSDFFKTPLPPAP
ncbi:MAG TPA: helix-turn-helix transcriptional regulator [Polyangiaceae bacterium]|nr:helix-turn-helix transcriptional regulator [Polyangiaceae bacterium]